MSYYTPFQNPLPEPTTMVFDALPSTHIVRGLVPTTFQIFRAGADPTTDTPQTQHDDYVRFEYQLERLRAMTVEKIMLASARELLNDVGGMGEWSSIRREGGVEGNAGGSFALIDVYIVREQETPKRVYLDRFHDSRDPERPNARLADWIEWGVLVKDPTRFRFEVLLEVKANKGQEKKHERKKGAGQRNIRIVWGE
ncbi:hypothetical protein PG990_002498 [Apiospora arundinis]